MKYNDGMTDVNGINAIPKTRTLANGAKQDIETGRIVAGAVLTRDKARDMVRARVEKKRKAVAEAANDAVQRGDLRVKYGDTAYIAEIAQAQMQIATTPDAGKAAVMAASWIVEHSGMSEKQVEQQVVQPRTQPDVVLALLAVLDGADNYNYRKHDDDVIDADTADEGGG